MRGRPLTAALVAAFLVLVLPLAAHAQRGTGATIIKGGGGSGDITGVTVTVPSQEFDTSGCADSSGDVTCAITRRTTNSVGNWTGSVTYDFANGNNVTATLTGNTTLTCSNPVDGTTYKIIVTQDATGGRSLTLCSGSTVAYPGLPSNGVTPTINLLPSSVTEITLYARSGDYIVFINKDAATGSAPNPKDLVEWDDFLSSGISTAVNGNIGKLSWAQAFDACAACSQTWQAGVFPHPGVTRITTDANDNNRISIWLNPVSATSDTAPVASLTGNMAGNAGWDATFIFKLPSITSVGTFVGFAADSRFVVATPLPANAIGIRFDTDVPDTNWTFHTCATTCTATTTNTVAATADRWVKFRMRSAVAGTVLMSMCQGASATAGCTLGTETSVTATLPTTGLVPVFTVATRTTASKDLDIDYFSFTWALNR